RLAADKRNREEEQQRARIAEVTKGEEKQQIAIEEKEKDRKFCEQEKSKRDADVNSATSHQPTPLEGRGSVWNPSSYHWEEKPMTSWCQETLKDRLSNTGFHILDNSTTLQLFNITVEGEASNTIRKGRKLVIFDLTIGADWTATARDESGVFLADSRGRLEINDFTSETAEEYQLMIRGDGKIPAQQRIDTAARKELPSQLQQLLRQFVQDLRSRG
ncbi:activator of 90 kDa heat shock protein ATPase homolog 2-like, partial [Ochotona princeps]|uniref:activator of 90 kDa heat shock protein ATPase homolog 2-like n=1 Tax=Ochotona princeps TaxID=9978 RepID=UPI00271478CA